MLVSVILAAGKGTRMRSDLPKVLHPLLGVPILEHVLDTVEALGPQLKVVVVGYKHTDVEESFPGRDIRWSLQADQLGTAHAANCGVEAAAAEISANPDAQVLVVNGDLPLLRVETLKALSAIHREADAAVTILTCEKADPTGYGRIIRDAQGRVRDIVEENDATEAEKRLREINVGAYVFRGGAFLGFYARIGRDNAQGELYLTDVVVKAAQAGTRVSSFKVADEAEVAQVNSRIELARVTDILRTRLLDEYMRSGVTIYDPRTTYIEKGVRIGRDTHILPFTMIEHGVEIGSGCEIGPFTHLRPGTRLDDGASIGNFVEIKNSKVGHDSKVRHLSYVGDGLIGQKVNIGAGTIFANYDGKVKSTTVVEDEAFVGSGTVLVAPVTVGKGAITGAGSVVLKNRNVPAGGVAVGVPAQLLKEGKGSSNSRS